MTEKLLSVAQYAKKYGYNRSQIYRKIEDKSIGPENVRRKTKTVLRLKDVPPISGRKTYEG